MNFDLNCDLGEGEPWRKTSALLGAVTSANIACGGHAGDVESMRRTVAGALKHGVLAGAHPGPADRAGFGRGSVALRPEEFRLLLLHQVGALDAVLRAAGGVLHHIKLHGALYHAVELSAELRCVYLATVREFWPRAIVFARAGGLVEKEGGRNGIRVWPEGFLDRGYLSNGALVPRGEPNALLSLALVRERLKQVQEGRAIFAVDGTELPLRPRTWCIHSDGPHALEIARQVKTNSGAMDKLRIDVCNTR